MGTSEAGTALRGKKGKALPEDERERREVGEFSKRKERFVSQLSLS
jgi:hypothetical protein